MVPLSPLLKVYSGDDAPVSVSGGMLDVTPGEEVWFGSGSSGVRRAITLANIRGAPVAFKVRPDSSYMHLMSNILLI